MTSRRPGVDTWFPVAVLVMPPAGLFLLWLQSPGDPSSTEVGTWCSAGMLVLLTVILMRRR